MSFDKVLKRLGFSVIEQRNHNPRVGGSSPSSATRKHSQIDRFIYNILLVWNLEQTF